MKLVVLAEEGTEKEEWDAEFKTRNAAPKAMLCMNFYICIRPVLHSWFYLLQMDYFNLL